jgi:hypothetical protein
MLRIREHARQYSGSSHHWRSMGEMTIHLKIGGFSLTNDTCLSSSSFLGAAYNMYIKVGEVFG